MAPTRSKNIRGFSLVELLVGMSLALIVMSAVLSSYLFLGRNLTRLVNQQAIETQARRTLGYFAQDVRMATDISSPSATGVTFTVKTSTGTTNTVGYTYDSTAKTLTRKSPASTGTALILMNNISTNGLTISYYDESGNPYTTYTNYLKGIKQIALSFTARAGSSVNGTQTQLLQISSPRLILRNRDLLQ
jgi:prepilin-type N-terminal cleavage/methylation domain-containing protein